MKQKMIRLIQPTKAHAALWLSWRQELPTLRYNPIIDSDLVALAQHLDGIDNDLSAQRNRYRWMIEADGEVVGTVSAGSFSWRMGYGEIGYQLGQAWHGQGIGTRAVALLVDKLFNGTALRRLIALIAVDNEASICLAKRLGFVVEGNLREHYIIQGTPTDELILGLLRTDWEKSIDNVRQ